jgi:hypothetical protein
LAAEKIYKIRNFRQGLGKQAGCKIMHQGTVRGWPFCAN